MDAEKGRVYRDPVETGKKNRDVVMSRGAGEARWGCGAGVGFLLTGTGFWWPSRLSRPMVWGWDPGWALGSLSCVFLPLLQPGGVRVGAYKAGWEGGRWGHSRAGLGEVMALRDARSRWPGLGQTMIAAAGGVGAALRPGVVSLQITRSSKR